MMPPTVDAKVNPNVPRYTPPKRGAGDAMSSSSGAFEDALFMLAVRPKDSENVGDSLPLFQSVMPSDSVVASDARGGFAARAPSRGVQLFTKDRVSIALYSQHDSLLASDLIDQFREHRNTYASEPRARANALRAWLKRLHDEKHVFSLALFDDSGRAFAAWTPRSAPLSFGHAEDGSAVVVAAAPHKRTLVGEHGDKHVNLAHLPAGRFVYGHGYLKPFEFTQLWASAETNRAGVSTMRTAEFNSSPEKPPVDDHSLSVEEKKKWRWEHTGSRAEQADRWTKKDTESAAPATPERMVATKVSPQLSPAAPVFAAKKAKLSVTDPVTAAARRLDFAIGAIIHFAFRKGLARVKRYDQRPDKRFLTLLLMRRALFVDDKKAKQAKALEEGSERQSVLASAMDLCVAAGVSNATSLKSTETTEQIVSNANPGAVFGLVAAVKKTARDFAKRKSQKDLQRKLAAPARIRGVAGSVNSSVVVCDLNGRCCVGDQCFIG